MLGFWFGIFLFFILSAPSAFSQQNCRFVIEPLSIEKNVGDSKLLTDDKKWLVYQRYETLDEKAPFTGIALNLDTGEKISQANVTARNEAYLLSVQGYLYSALTKDEKVHFNYFSPKEKKWKKYDGQSYTDGQNLLIKGTISESIEPHQIVELETVFGNKFKTKAFSGHTGVSARNQKDSIKKTSDNFTQLYQNSDGELEIRDRNFNLIRNLTKLFPELKESAGTYYNFSFSKDSSHLAIFNDKKIFIFDIQNPSKDIQFKMTNANDAVYSLAYATPKPMVLTQLNGQAELEKRTLAINPINFEISVIPEKSKALNGVFCYPIPNQKNYLSCFNPFDPTKTQIPVLEKSELLIDYMDHRHILYRHSGVTGSILRFGRPLKICGNEPGEEVATQINSFIKKNVWSPSEFKKLLATTQLQTKPVLQNQKVELTWFAYKNIGIDALITYFELQNTEVKLDGITRVPAVGEKNKAKVKADMHSLFKDKTLVPNFNNAMKMAPLARKVFTEAEERDYWDWVADYIKDYQMSLKNQIYDHMFASKLYEFTFHSLLRGAGLPYSNLQDVAFINLSNTYYIYRLSVTPEEKFTTQSAYGFYFENISNFGENQIPKRGKTSINFDFATNDNQKFKSTIDFQIVPFDGRSLVPKIQEFDKQSVLADGIIRGALIIGTNMGKKMLEILLSEYDHYLQEQGFVQTGKDQREGATQYLVELTSGEKHIDYFMKEAHSDGDEKNLFRSAKKLIVLNYTNSKAKVPEEFSIAYPADFENTELISNQEFGKAVQLRAKKYPNEYLFYLNGSCSSYQKAVHEILAAKSDRLVNVAVKGSGTTFTSSDHSAFRHLIDSARFGRSFDETRKILAKKTAGYSDSSADRYIFPGDEEYEELILKKLDFAVEVKANVFKLKDSSGQWLPFEIDKPW